MKNTVFRFTRLGCALAVGMMISQGQLALAGWTGAMNGTGYGQASVNVRAFETSLLKTRKVTTTNMLSPSAAITTTEGYVFGAPLPADASPATVAKAIGFPGYIWQAATVGSNGDTTDNPPLESRVTINPSDCAALEMTSSANIAPDQKSGTITVNAKGTAGTAIWLRGFEFTGDFSELPENVDPTYDEDGNITDYGDRFLEFLKTHGSLKWDVLLVGPFDLNTATCSALTIPFTIDTDPSHLYFVSDGVAKSLPLEIYCPDAVEVKCDEQPVVYPQVQVAGCGNITVDYDPPAGTSFPVGNNPVTATATDKDGNTKSCTFNVIVTDTTPPVAPELAIVTGDCSAPVTLTAPTATDNCAGIVTGATTDPLSYSKAGTYTVHWTFDDGNGNVTTADQKVIVNGLTFYGFYSPVGGTGGTCNKPLLTVNQGSKVPTKFDFSCGTTPITGGTAPIVRIQDYTGCTAGSVVIIHDAEYQNDWHYNWDTSGSPEGIYKVSVELPDGTTRYYFVKLR